MHQRLNNFRSRFKHHIIDAYIVTKSVNIKYLTRFDAEDSWLLITKTKAFYITDSRYTLAAKKGLKGISVQEYKESFYKTVFELAKRQKIKRLGFDENHFTVAQFNALKKVCPRSVKLIAANHLVEHLREIKDAKEISAIKKALKIHAQALKYLKKIIRPGKTERDILHALESFVRDKNVTFSFDPIIASGPNGAFPHASITGRKVGQNDVVLVDFGIDVEGYKSDLTRMFFLGKISNLIGRVNDSVAQSQLEAIAIIKDGVAAAQVDAAARNYLAKNDLEKYFGHSLGHGVGLEIHENPRLSSKTKSVLRAGMVVTVEPGVYWPGKFGVRIEDMVLVTKKGCEVLSGDID